ncbi:hypothetical protein CCR75_003355 [Bremia lactucae]|uniref:Uncharacterized protein n=1 Tax=Bremia lactucae TaxID=4779 RepID=A0A976IC67_BRELC|nr:hypothetical protein CCR75_003355 [Bremia lactucae]
MDILGRTLPMVVDTSAEMEKKNDIATWDEIISCGFKLTNEQMHKISDTEAISFHYACTFALASTDR